MSTTMNSTTAQQRRGKQQHNNSSSTTPLQIDDGSMSGVGPINMTSSSVVSATTTGGGMNGILDNSRTIRRATVRRNFCGTGPFDRHWLNLDCCGLFCAGFTYLLHAYGVYAVCWVLLPPWMSVTDTVTGIRRLSMAGLIHQTAFCAIAVVACISHFMAMTTDPGAVPPDAKPLPPIIPTPVVDPSINGSSANGTADDKEKEGLLASVPKTTPPETNRGKKLCRRCRAFKPQRAHHCSICRRCIIKMDHHCPWVNNCVGIGNHKYFLLFVFYTCLSCIYSLLLVVVRFATCVEGGSSRGRHHHVRHSSTMTCLDKPTQLLTILGLMIEALLFALFTMCMIGDQASVVFSKMTHIDRLKGVDISGSLAGIQEVFGVGRSGGGVNNTSRFRPDWLSPFARVCFPPSVRDEVMGFCRPCQSNNNNSKPAASPTGSAGGGGGSSVLSDLSSSQQPSTAAVGRNEIV